ncbi:MAG TPA: hypothetical protein VN683_11115, partial [Acidothermaceae bacterium]|nr:hypothetical protein [Acidothermaceae bacterium]
HTSAGCIRSRGGIGVPISYQQCDRAEAEAAFQTALGRKRHGISTRSKTLLMGSPAQSVVQWAGPNAELFR